MAFIVRTISAVLLIVAVRVRSNTFSVARVATVACEAERVSAARRVVDAADACVADRLAPTRRETVATDV